MHSFFLLLVVIFGAWAAFTGRPIARGIALWGLLLLSVLVRELARALAAAGSGVELRSLVLLPTGGLLTVNPGSARSERKLPNAMRWTGPAASLLLALVCAGLVLAVAPGVNFVARPWVSPEHLVRSVVWMNVLLAVVNLLPAWPLDAGQAQAQGAGNNPAEAGSDSRRSQPVTVGATRMIAPGVAVALILLGLFSVNWWLIAAGVTVLLGAQVERQGALRQTGAAGVTVGEVMLTEYSILSASATLEDAAAFSRHTLQDIFPVVRAGNLVGAIGRGEVMAALEGRGNGYVQGLMTRSFQTASPSDLVVDALSRITQSAGSSAQLVPVLEGEQVVGILTPANLQRAMGLVSLSLRARERKAHEDESD